MINIIVIIHYDVHQCIIININLLVIIILTITIQVTVLVEEINFANGLELDPSENFLLFCETGMARVYK